MKAIRAHSFGGPEVLQLDDARRSVAGPGQVRVRLHAAGVNPFDTYMLTGTYAIKPPLPYSPGADGAGVVDAVGAGCDRRRRRRPRLHRRHRRPQGLRRVSRRWCCAASSRCTRCRIGVSFSEGAAVNVPCVTAFRALDRAGAGRRRHRARPRRERRGRPGRGAAGAGGRDDGHRLGRHRRRPRSGASPRARITPSTIATRSTSSGS